MPIMVSPNSVVFCKRNEGRQVPISRHNGGGVCPLDHSELELRNAETRACGVRSPTAAARVRLVEASAPSCTAIMNGGVAVPGVRHGLGSITLPLCVGPDPHPLPLVNFGPSNDSQSNRNDYR